jgi:hypothetical protein
MEMQRVYRSLSCALIAVASNAVASSGFGEFGDASFAAEKKLNTKRGYDYMVKFEEWISHAAIDVMKSCASNPRSERECNIVFIVGADG